ncbi:WXG100 family type VII secretion target [Micromonospora echinofusca]|uniref:ESAT-6-like protein n=1 Tax=Micromonospora echinofusca TaxID=47858 RepID=A0ABS3VS05_MICEH|nr:WXG100 family type VII secretion target [Micromonospora echinofusca]MBO4207308.1 WXG100 family type VII secretion target [Micromonospora echinofusca]
MATQMNVSIDQMRAAQARFTEGAATARSVLNSVQSVGGSIGGVWRGPASVAYQQTLTEWGSQYGRVVTALEGLRDALRGSVTRLEAAEQAAQQQSKL